MAADPHIPQLGSKQNCGTLVNCAFGRIAEGSTLANCTIRYRSLICEPFDKHLPQAERS